MNNGNGDLSGLDFGGPDAPGSDIPGPGDLPGFDAPGSDIPGPADLPASAPSTIDNLSNAFSPFEFEESEVETSKGKGLTFGQLSDKAAAWGITLSRYGPLGVVGGFFDLFGKAFIDVTAAIGLNEGKGYTPGQAIDKGLTALGMTQAQAPAQAQAQPSSTPLARGAPITLSPDGYKGMKSEGNLESVLSFSPAPKAPSSYGSPYYTGYQPLSMSLFQAKENGGMMIFPTSGGGVEPEMSSLMKKEQSIINTPNLLFLMGMGLLGIVLRGKK